MISLEKATIKDLEAVLELIKELAMYEKAPAEVTLNLKQLQDDFLNADPAIHILLAKQNEKVCGMAFYFFTYSTWKGKALYLEDIIVKESLRRTGIGSALFNEVIKIAKEANVQRMAWQALDWNEPAIRFYEKFGAEADPEWINFRFNKEMLDKL